MPDIAMRFGKDMLVLSSSIDASLKKRGIDAEHDRQFFNLMEPDSVQEVMSLESAAGAQCLVTNTEDITRARLSYMRMESDAHTLAQAALRIVNDLNPQHVLAHIEPCGLPLDDTSKASLNENRKQYADAAAAFSSPENQPNTFDAYLLSGFTKLADLKCALMGLAQVSDKPIFASVTISQPGSEPSHNTNDASSSHGHTQALDADRWEEAVGVMLDLGASVIGFETADPLDEALDYAQIAVSQAGAFSRPVLAQLAVQAFSEAQELARTRLLLEEINDYTPDILVLAAEQLRQKGVQFLRATGESTPSCTGALVAALSGLNVVCES